MARWLRTEQTGIMGIAANTWVETIRGRLRAHEIEAGMYVFGMDGLPTKVKFVQTYMPQKFFYVEFSDGSGVEGDQFLNLPVKNWVQRVRYSLCKGKCRSEHRRIQKYRTPEQILETGLNHTHYNRKEYTVDTVAPLNYGYEDHAVPPFIAGMWYANLTKNNKYPIVDELKQFVKENVQRSKQFIVVENDSHLAIRPSVEAVFLRDYATIPTTEFPYKYLYGTPEQRIEFLSGYFSVKAASYNKKKDRFRINTRRGKYHVQMIQVICESLGIKTVLNQAKPFWELIFRTRLPILPIQKPAGRKTGEKYRRIMKVEPCVPRQCVHIETEKPIAVSDSFVPIWHLQTNKNES